MSNLTTRAGKGSPLTNNELDANFTNLNADKVEIGGDLSGTPTAPIVTKVQGQSFSSAAANVGEKLVWNGTAWAPATDPSGEPIGHADKSESSIGFNAGTRTFTISPVSASFVVWCKGVKHTYTSAQTVVIPNTTGLHFIYFNASGVLSTQMTYFTWAEHAPTAYIYWNATTQQAVYFGDERHGIALDWQTHEYLHRTRGAAIANGFLASGYTLNSSATDAATQIAIESGTFFDEDMKIDIVSTATPTAGTYQQNLLFPAKIPVLHLQGTSWVMDAPTDFPFKQGTARPQYNSLSGGVWSTADVGNNQHATTWILATNNLTYPVIAIIGQSATDNLGEAEAFSFADLTLTGFPSVEFRPLYKLIYKASDGYANSVNARLESIVDLRSISAVGSAANTATDHGNLSGLSDDDHPQYLSVDTVRGSLTAAVKASFLPSQTSNNGKYLTTDGINPSWGDVPSGSLTFTGDVTGTGNTGSSTTLTLANSGVTAGTFTKVTVDTKGRVTTGASANSSDIATALGFTPENVANKAVANGYASLDGSGKVPSNQLPSYVDDVLEYANLAAFPATGETGKIYIAIDTVKTYRWSGSAYVEITSSPGSTDAVPEGSTNLYFTNARARAAVGASGSLSYSTATGIFSYTQPTNVSAFTNDSGYLTGITGAQVTSALGYTPYNATNPAGYTTNVGTVTSVSGTGTVSGLTLTGSVTSSGSLTLGGTLSLTSGQVTTALGYTPYNATNPSGYITSSSSITGNAATVSSITGNTGLMVDRLTPSSTIDGLTTSNFRSTLFGTTTNSAAISAARWNTTPSVLSGIGSYGTMIAWAAADTQGFLALDYNSANAKIGGGNGNNINWSATLLHSSNYNDYAPSKIGTGASGTWGISITGNAATATSATDSTKLPLSGGTLTGTTTLSSGQFNLSAASQSINTTTPGTTLYSLNFTGQGTPDYAQAITWGWSTSGAQAGIYVQSSGSYGTKMYLATTDAFVSGAKTALTIDHSGIITTNRNYLQATGSLRAPIFYDSDDTARYFNGTGGINFLTGSSNRVTIYSSDEGLFVNNAEGCGVAVRVGAAYGLPGIYVNPNLYLSSESNVIFRIANGERGYMDVGSNLFAYGSMRSPIFYDQNNTAYYGDFASAGVSLFVRGQIQNPSVWINNGDLYNAYNENIRLFSPANGVSVIAFSATGTSGTPVTSILGYTDRQEVRFNDTWQQRIYNGYVEANGSFRAPIFYDSNNTGYYLDAASNSVFYKFDNINQRVAYDRAWSNYPSITVYNTTDQGPQGEFRIHGAAGANGGDFSVDLRVDGSVIASGISYGFASSRAPIFYDYDNTGYYGDFSSTGDSINAAGSANFGNGGSNTGIAVYHGGGSGDYGRIRFYQAGNNNTTIHVFSTAWQGGSLQSTSAGSINLSGASGVTFGPWNANNGWVDTSGNGQFNGSSRAPIFYDSNDTGYYLDPNSTSNSALRIRGGALHGPNPTWGQYLYVGTDGRPSSDASVCVTDGNLHIDCKNGSLIYLNYYSGRPVVCGSDIRATLFYDSENTGYYVDPASTSSLNSITVNGTSNYYAQQYFVANRNTTSDSPPLQAFSNNGSGAIMSFHRGGYYAVNFGLDSDNVMRIGGWSAAANRWVLDMSGNNIVAGSSRAPIFYDSDNTGYYVDPSSTGTALNIAGNISCVARSASWAEGIRVDVPSAGTWGGIRFTRNNVSGPGNWAIGFTGLNSSDDLTFYGGTNNLIQLNLDQSGNLIARGNITAYGSPSDRRLKENIEPLIGALNKIMRLQGCTFRWKEDSREYEIAELRDDVGFIADEVQEILPDMVRRGSDGYLSLRDRGFSALLVEAVKEQQAQITAMLAEINSLKERLH